MGIVMTKWSRMAAHALMAPGLGALPPSPQSKPSTEPEEPTAAQLDRAARRRLAKAQAKAQRPGPTPRKTLGYGIPEISRAGRRSLGYK